MFTSSTSSKPENERDRLTKGFSKATMLLTGSGPPIHKQLKTAIQECNEDKAIAIYMSKDGNKILPSKPFPTKKVGGPQDTPLHSTARFGLSKLFKLFLEYGGNPSIPNAKSENCAHTVCSASTFPAKRLEILDLIFDWRGRLATSSDSAITTTNNSSNLDDFVPIDALDIDGNTALHLAAQFGLLICIERLIERGATLDIMNSQDFSCCELADRGNFPHIGMMLELAWLFQPGSNIPLQLSQTFHKFSGGGTEEFGRIVVDSRSITLSDVIEYINHAIKYIADEFDETAARAEVLLHYAQWDVTKLKKELSTNLAKVLSAVKMKQRVYPPGYQKKIRVNVGISVEDVYLDPSYASISSFAVIQPDGKKKFFSFQQIDSNGNGGSGKVGVFPIDYDPTFRYIDQPPNADPAQGGVPSHIQTKRSDAVCQLCQEPMFERVAIQHFIQNTCAEPLKREISCTSGHRYCFSCWNDHLQNEFILKTDSTNSLHALSCPNPDCGEVLDLQWAPIFFNKADHVNRLLAQRQRKVIDHLNLKWCPVVNCGLLVKICGMVTPSHAITRSPSPALTAEGSGEYVYKGIAFNVDINAIPKVAICGHGHGFCLQCFHEAHAPCTCSELTSWQDLLRDATKQVDQIRSASNSEHFEEEYEEAILLTYPSSKKCKKCGTTMHKEDGCNAVTCHGCFSKCCWTCLKDWSSFHTNGRYGAVHYCNRVGERSMDPMEAASEEKLEEQTSSKGRLNRAQRLKRIVHYYARFMAHFASRKVECDARIFACERILDGLHASADGELLWLQGGAAANPWMDQTAEEEVVVRFYHSRKHNGASPANTDVVPIVEDYCLEKDEPIEFIQTAFEELEKARTLLQWSYPFSLFEFDDKLSVNFNPPKISQPLSPEMIAYRAKALELRPEFELLQACLEYETEMLSNMIARRRFRGTKQHISVQTTIVRGKRAELEQLVLYFYSFKLPAIAPKAPAIDRAPQANSQSESDDRMNFGDDIRIVPDVDISDEDNDPFIIPKKPIEPPAAQPAPVAELPPRPSPIERKKTFSKITADDFAVNDEDLLPLKQKIQAAKTLFKAGSQLNILLEQVRMDNNDPDKKKKKKKKQRVPSLYIRHSSGSDDDTDTFMESQGSPSADESKYSNPSQVLPTPIPEPPPPPPVVQSAPEPPIESPVMQPPVIEQRYIGAKKDPDEEALEHAILISKQEEEFGVNMYDSLVPDDEPVIDDYISQGFTREEAILIVFEHKVGKVSILANQPITPAMPTLHKLPTNVPNSQAHLIGPEDEGEVEYLMARGYTREQAIEVILHKRNRKQQRGSGSHNNSGNNLTQQGRPVVPRVAVNSVSATPPLQQGSIDSYGPPHLGSQSRNSMDFSQMDERSAIQSLLGRGYTLEQATSVYRSSIQNKNMNSVPPQILNIVADEQAMARHNQFMVADAYATQEDSEIAQLMARGFTREQANQIIKQTLPSNNSNNNANRTSTANNKKNNRSNPASNNKNAPPSGGEDEVQRLVAQGYTREQATQIILLSASNTPNNGTMPQTMGRAKSTKNLLDDVHQAQSDSTSQGSRSIYRASGMVNPSDELDDFEIAMQMQQTYNSGQQQLIENDQYGDQYGGMMPASASNYAPTTTSSAYYEQQMMAADPYMMGNGNHTNHKSAMEFQLLASQQDAEYGINMYDSLIPTDEPEINHWMSAGYSRDEAVLFIFQKRYQGVTGQPMQQQQPPPQPPMPPQQKISGVMTPVPNASSMPIVPTLGTSTVASSVPQMQQQQLPPQPPMMAAIEMYNNQLGYMQPQQQQMVEIYPSLASNSGYLHSSSNQNVLSHSGSFPVLTHSASYDPYMVTTNSSGFMPNAAPQFQQANVYQPQYGVQPVMYPGSLSLSIDPYDQLQQMQQMQQIQQMQMQVPVQQQMQQQMQQPIQQPMQQQMQYGYPYQSVAEQQQQQSIYSNNNSQLGYYAQHGMVMEDSYGNNNGMNMNMNQQQQQQQRMQQHHNSTSAASAVRSPSGGASTAGGSQVQKKKVFRGASLFGLSPSHQAASNSGGNNGSQGFFNDEDALSRAIRLSEEEAKQRNNATAAQYYQGQKPPLQQQQQQPQSKTLTPKKSGLFSSPSPAPTTKGSRASSNGDGTKVKYKSSDVKQLEKMGFSKDQAVQALLESNNDVNAAAELLANSFYHHGR